MASGPQHSCAIDTLRMLWLKLPGFFIIMHVIYAWWFTQIRLVSIISLVN